MTIARQAMVRTVLVTVVLPTLGILRNGLVVGELWLLPYGLFWLWVVATCVRLVRRPRWVSLPRSLLTRRGDG
jgi:hypothetical protein